MGFFSRNRNRSGYGYNDPFNGGQDIVSEVLEVEAIEDLVDGDIGGFVEDEMLAEIL